jgi:hypothetical protein
MLRRLKEVTAVFDVHTHARIAQRVLFRRKGDL